MTGTRDFNVKGIKQFEDRVYNYLKQNQTNHVLYRVTPYFEGANKLANGVNIEHILLKIMELYILMCMYIMCRMELLLIMQREKVN